MAWMMDTYSNHVRHVVPGWSRASDFGRRLAGPARGDGRRRRLPGQEYLDDLAIPLRKATVAIQGFGNVGSEAALALQEYGARIIAISDYTGGIRNAKGIDVARAVAYVNATKSLKDFDGGESITNAELLELKCTVLVPAALERVIHGRMPRK